MPSDFFSRIVTSEAFVYNSYFFRTAVLWKLFDIRFSYKHCNFSQVCLLVKVASKTVTRSITDITKTSSKYSFLYTGHYICVTDDARVGYWANLKQY